MPGTWFSSLCILLSVALAPLYGSAPIRVHEIQFRHNGYARVPAPALLLAGGFDKVILRVFSDDEKNGGLYYLNSVFRTVRPVLESWAPQFGKGGIGLWAWMGSRYFSWVENSRLLDVELRNFQRHVIPKLDLFNPDAEALIVAMFMDLARKPIRGILIQDDLTLRRYEGFSNWGKAYFVRATGLAVDERRMVQAGTSHGQAWERCKCERVAQILNKVVSACKAVNPNLCLGMNIHYELPLEPQQARSWYAHDLEALLASGLDHFYLMAYHRQIKSELGLTEAANRAYFAQLTIAALEYFGPRLVVKLQARDWRSGALIPFEELKTYYDLIPAGVTRICFAAVDPEDIPFIARIITVDQVLKN